jgi:photosystem II stability/assembly factor-like uncharacterized protein
MALKEDTMEKRFLATIAAVLVAASALLGLLSFFGQATFHLSPVARAAPLDAPTVITVDPSSAPNDLDTPIVISGTGFAAGLMGTLVITSPTVWLGNTQLPDVGWVSSTTLTATVPWGMNPGVYTLTVTNPEGQSGSLPNAFTVTQGIGVWTTGGPYGGTINNITLNPLTPTTLYASASGVGVFRSRDGGENWEQVFAATGGSRVEMDPLSPNRIYSGRSGDGPYRSDDEGNTWTAIPIPGKSALTYQAFAHPTIAGTVYVGLGDSNWCQGDCFWKSENYGQTWVTSTNGLTDTMVNALAFDPANPLKVYAGTTNGDVFRSVNGGESWEFIGQPDQYINQLAINPFGAHELWACGAGIGHWGYLWKYASGAWISSSLGTGATAIVFDQHISGTMWVGASKSTDGGSAWIPFGMLPGPGPIALAVDPTDSRVVYQGFFGRGIYKTADDGMTWQEVNHGMTGIIPYWLAVAPAHPSTVYAATTGTGIYKTTNGGNAWRRLSGAEGWDEPVVVDPITPTRIYYSFDGGVNISEDGGDNWHRVYVQAPPQYAACCQAATLSLIANPGMPGHLVMGVGFMDKSLSYYNLVAGGIYTSTDFGETWSWADVGQVISPVIALASDPFSPTVIYAGTGNPESAGTGVWKSIDGGATWFASGFAGLAVSGIAVDRRDSQTVYAVAHGAFYVSRDAGQTWDCIYGADPHLEGIGQNLLYVPTVPPVFYAYDWRGMVRSTDEGFHWQRPAGALAYSNIGAMAVAATTDRVVIYIGTSGGMASGGAPLAESQASGETLVSAGVYRQTTRLLNQRIYLPVILKGYTQ